LNLLSTRAVIGCGGTGSDELCVPILAVPPVRSSRKTQHQPKKRKKITNAAGTESLAHKRKV